ncbi:tail fiber assembly protein, partial [Yersinia pekkanenii]
PPPTHAELILLAQHKKAELIAEAAEVIDPMRDAKDGDYIDAEDVPRLTAWQKYRYALTKVDVSKAPDIEWPVAPE